MKRVVANANKKIFQNVPLPYFPVLFSPSAQRGTRQWHYKENVTSVASYAIQILDAHFQASVDFDWISCLEVSVICFCLETSMFFLKNLYFYRTIVYSTWKVPGLL